MNREAFEIIAANLGYLLDKHPINNDRYLFSETNDAYRLWQATLESQQVPEGYVLINNETLRGIANVLGNDFPDCIDNDGQPYQSQYLADLLTASQEQVNG